MHECDLDRFIAYMLGQEVTSFETLDIATPRRVTVQRVTHSRRLDNDFPLDYYICDAFCADWELISKQLHAVPVPAPAPAPMRPAAQVIRQSE